jgi:hypothetical protein
MARRGTVATQRLPVIGGIHQHGRVLGVRGILREEQQRGVKAGGSPRRQARSFPGPRQHRHDRRIELDDATKAVAGECRLKLKDAPHLGLCILCTAERHQRGNQKHMADAEARVELHGAARRIMSFRGASCAKVGHYKCIAGQVIQ